eukprot:3105706-Prymnesium_polylepis.1
MSVRFPEGQAGNPQARRITLDACTHPPPARCGRTVNTPLGWQVGKIPTGPHAGKNIFDKDVPLDDTIKGLLKMMP